jgi:hypothetical protein
VLFYDLPAKSASDAKRLFIPSYVTKRPDDDERVDFLSGKTKNAVKTYLQFGVGLIGI